MKEVEYFSFMMPPTIWCKRPHPSSFKMTIEEAAERYPGVPPIPSSRESRWGGGEPIPADAPYQRRSRSKPPAEEQLQAWLVSRIGEQSEEVQAEKGPAARYGAGVQDL